MSVQAITWAFKQDITPAGLKFVLVALANYASDDGYCYPSQKTIAKLTGQSERAARGHIATLEAAGFIRREARRKGDGSYISDGFYLLFDQRQILPEVDSADGRNRVIQRQQSSEPAADSAANTKEGDTKEETKEVAPMILRIRERDAKRLARQR